MEQIRKERIYDLYFELAWKVADGKANSYEVKRYHEATRLFEKADIDDGIWGKLEELLNVSATSHKTEVSKQGEVDNYFYYEGSRKPVEYKTNGGRIEALYRLRKPENSFIVYSMDFETRQTYRKDGTPRPTKHYVVEPIILRVSDFLAILEHCNAVKVLEHKGKNDRERAVQGDSAKLAKCLADYPVTFDPNAKYTSADFEDLELF